MFEKVLFATDFSAYAKKTLDCIAGFPGARDVILFHVVEKAISPRGGGEIGDILYRTGDNPLKEEKRHLENLSPNLRVTTAVKTSSDTAGAIIETARERSVSLIVVGARGNSPVEGLLLGSVSMAVLRRSRTHVLIMRHKIIEEMKEKTYELFCPRILSRVLCPTDFSPHAGLAAEMVHNLPNVGEMILFHAVSRDDDSGPIESRVQEAKEGLEAMRSRLTPKGAAIHTEVRTGDAAAEINRLAEEKDVSLVCLSSYGAGWLGGLPLGSTAADIAIRGKRPLLVLRTHLPEPERTGPVA